MERAPVPTDPGRRHHWHRPVSEALIGAVESVTHQLGLTEFFIGIIIIPLVGNVAEHVVAVQVAIKNRMDLSMAVAIGSSTQIALFVAPLLVFIALLFNERLLLVYNSYELVALAAASLIAAFIALDGESNWLGRGDAVGSVCHIGAGILFRTPACLTMVELDPQDLSERELGRLPDLPPSSRAPSVGSAR